MIDHIIVKGKQYAHISVRQSPGLAVFIHAARLFVNDPGFAPDLKRLCDFSQANLNHITEDDFKKFVEFAIENVPLDPDTKVALVAPDPSKRGIFERFSEQIQVGQFGVFFDPDEAVMWITSEQPPAAPGAGLHDLVG